MNCVILKACLKKMQRVQKGFFCDTEDMKHVHILRWDEISKPVKLGGMGMKKLDDMDKAFLLKV